VSSLAHTHYLLPSPSHRHSVLTFSGVFLDAGSHAGDGERTIHFTDPDIETYCILAFFMELLHDGSFVVDDTQAVDVGKFILFLRKYNCDSYIKIAVQNQVHTLFTRQWANVDCAVIAACVAEDEESVGWLLQKYHHEFDIREWGFELWSLIPPRFANAIQRVVTDYEKTKLRAEKKQRPVKYDLYREFSKIMGTLDECEHRWCGEANGRLRLRVCVTSAIITVRDRKPHGAGAM
jgi:hypothetical protein